MKPTYFCIILITVIYVLCGVSAKPHTNLSHHTSGNQGRSTSGKHQDADIRHPRSASYSDSYKSSSGLSGQPSSNSSKSSNSASGGLTERRSSYPASAGLSGSETRAAASYPKSNGMSGNGANKTVAINQRLASNRSLSSNTSFKKMYKKPGTSYPPSNSSLSGSGIRIPGKTRQTTRLPSHITSKPHIIYYPTSKVTSRPHYTERRPYKMYHHQYIYRPPTVIHYNPLHGTATSYPVYRGQYLPPYVNEYRSSENKYRQLLAGLALFNLGVVSSSHMKDHYHKTYVPKPDEICIFGVQYRTGNCDEMAIDCRVITNFIFEAESKTRTVSSVLNQTVTTNVNNQKILPNGTLVQTVDQVPNNFVPNEVMLPNGTLVKAEIANTIRLQELGEVMPHPQTLLPNGTVVDPVIDPKFYGSPVDVRPDMQCYVIKTTRFSHMKKSVPCDLLHTYDFESLHRSSAVAFKSSLATVMVAVAIILM